MFLQLPHRDAASKRLNPGDGSRLEEMRSEVSADVLDGATVSQGQKNKLTTEAVFFFFCASQPQCAALLKLNQHSEARAWG